MKWNEWINKQTQIHSHTHTCRGSRYGFDAMSDEMRSTLMSLYRMIVCVTDGAEVGEGKARNCTITGVAWVRSQKYHRQSILAFVSCYIPKHRSQLFVLQVLVLMVGLCILNVIFAVNDIRLKWLQCIYIYLYSIYMIWLIGKTSAHISEAMKLLPWGLQPWQKWLCSQWHREKT